MKLLFTALLASFASYTTGQNNGQNAGDYFDNSTPTALALAWGLDEPSIEYVSESNKFEMRYDYSNPNDNMCVYDYISTENTFYDKSCTNKKTSGFTQTSLIDNCGTIFSDFTMNHAVIASDSELYAEAKAEFCVRFSTGFQEGAEFREVNFYESVITVNYVLDGSFNVADVNIKPKDRVSKTENEEAYDLTAYLCSVGGTTDTSGDNTADTPFRQGDLITVCVKPLNADPGVVMNGLTSFTWTGTYGSPQTAIENYQPASNKLTSYNNAACVDAEVCKFSSILFADFYQDADTVSGSGEAKVKFSRRRLGDEDRALQEADAESEFGLSVNVGIAEDGPGAIKTAGGVSVGLTALASIMALAGSILFF